MDMRRWIPGEYPISERRVLRLGTHLHVLIIFDQFFSDNQSLLEQKRDGELFVDRKILKKNRLGNAINGDNSRSVLAKLHETTPALKK